MLIHVNIKHGHEVFNILIPFSCHNIVLKRCHDNASHFDVRKTL